MRHFVLAVLLLPVLARAEDATLLKRGAPLGKSPAVELSKILESPKAYAGKTVITEGEVRAVCSRKGCWMELAQADKGCRVTFKDYGFFVPKDSKGAHARIEAEIQVNKVSKEMVEHYREEGASLAQAADGSAQEVRLVASGVELTRTAQKQQ